MLFAETAHGMHKRQVFREGRLRPPIACSSSRHYVWRARCNAAEAAGAQLYGPMLENATFFRHLKIINFRNFLRIDNEGIGIFLLKGPGFKLL